MANFKYSDGKQTFTRLGCGHYELQNLCRWKKHSQAFGPSTDLRNSTEAEYSFHPGLSSMFQKMLHFFLL